MIETSAITAASGVVLIADDSPDARKMLEVRVKREGHRSILVENGRQALDVLAKEPVDVVLLDIDMPELDGFAVLRTIKTDPKLAHLPVLIISGGGDDEDLVRCIELGAVDFLPKPFNQALLRARINACLLQARQRQKERQPPNNALNDTAPPAPAADETSDWKIVPPKMGRIAIKQLLGEGATGRVYLGHHELLDLPVAVKVMRAELTANPQARERFLREARLAARLAHRHIVRLLEVNDGDFGVYLALEYISGGTLQQLLNDQPARQLPLPTAIRIACEVTSALAEADRIKIIHRDIKPANLLLTPEGEIKVADFGLARQTQATDAAAAQVTMAGMVVGTPLYMAPEQLTLGGSPDIRTDLYALGSVLYEMLVGHAPFGAPAVTETLTGSQAATPSVTIHDIFHHQLHSAPQPPSQLRSDIPPWLEAVCLKLLSKNPADRFLTPDELLVALQSE